MRVRDYGCRSFPIISTTLLVACGGGGYNAPYMPPPPPPAMPTVSFTAPAQSTTIRFGRAVKLTWTSTNATSCTASTSSNTGGSFSGSEPVTGSATVAPTGPGNVTYTLTCTGTGGSASATASVTVSASILSTLSVAGVTMIGSTIDPTAADYNPYGLTIAPATAGLITQGDLVICNFNAGMQTQEGTGTTIVGLHPSAGAMPYRIAQSADLEGCNALAMLPDDSISAAAYMSNENPLVTAAGVVNMPFSSDAFGNPWGEAYVAANGTNPAALYVSNVVDGSIDRITLNGDAQSAFTVIATGFCTSGSPGAIYAPSGLTYDASIDTLYIVDTSSNSVVAFAGVSAIGSAGIVVNGQCSTVMAPPTPAPTFSGTSASSARVIATGGALFTPLSAALLSDGDLIVANADINIGSQTQNQVFEISPELPGGFVGAPLQLDSGAPGALFGIVATVDGQGNQIVYFNDDNANAVMKITVGP